MKDLLQKMSEINRRQELAKDYEKSLALLAALKEGTVQLGSVQLTESGWQLVEVKEVPEEKPATGDLLELLAKIKAGEVNPASVHIDLASQQWFVRAPMMIDEPLGYETNGVTGPYTVA